MSMCSEGSPASPFLPRVLTPAWASLLLVVQGRTGYPWIDAAMTQLREEGWIHHLARHAVACFLTRGDLWQSYLLRISNLGHCMRS